jgi:hypothetical protein
VDHSSDGHDDIMMPVATRKHTSDGLVDVVVPIATRKHGSDGRDIISPVATVFFLFQ